MLFCLLQIGLALGVTFDSGEDLIAGAVVVGPAVACGFVIARWPVVALALVAVPVGLFTAGGEVEAWFVVVGLLLIYTLGLGAGVSVARALRRLRHDS